MTAITRSGIPAPARRTDEPAAPVIGSPAPGIVAHPGPTIKIFPNPPAGAVRSPACINGRGPNLAIGRVADPAAIAVEILGAIDIAADILRTARALEIVVPVLVPAVPIVVRECVDHPH